MLHSYKGIKTDRLFQQYGIRVNASQRFESGVAEIGEMMGRLQREHVERWPRYEKQLRALIAQHPGVFDLYPALYNVYSVGGKERYQRELLNDMMQVFGPNERTVALLLLNARTEQSQRRLDVYLGPDEEITRYPARAEGYYLSEFLNFEHGIILRHSVRHDFYTAKKRLERLIDLGVDRRDLAPLALTIAEYEGFGGMEQMMRERALEILVETREPPEVPYPSTEPSFHHPESEELYFYTADDMTPDRIEAYLALPRETFVEDLYTIVRDPILRRGYFLAAADADLVAGDTLVVAFYFLHEVGEAAALPALLDLLRLDAETLDYMFFMDVEAYFLKPLYLLGQNREQELMDFLLEPYREGFARVTVVSALVQIALRHPERTESIVAGLMRIFETLLASDVPPGLVDTNFVTFATAEVSNLRRPEVLPVFRALDERGWIMSSAQGGLYTLEYDIHQPPRPEDVTPMPTDLYSFFSGDYLEPTEQPNAEAALTKLDAAMPPVARLIRWATLRDREAARVQNSAPFPRQEAPRSAQKVGRNEPCPCGSGRKYKHCCGKLG